MLSGLIYIATDKLVCKLIYGSFELTGNQGTGGLRAKLLHPLSRALKLAHIQHGRATGNT